MDKIKRLTVTDRLGEKHVFDGCWWSEDGEKLKVFRSSNSFSNAIGIFRDWSSITESEVRTCTSCGTESGLLRGDLCAKCQVDKYKAQEG